MAGAVRTVYAFSLAFNPVKAKIGREECGMKLLGVAELADGSLNFAFGVAPEGSTSSGNMLDTAIAAQTQLASSQLPVRLPSAFKKKSPISISTRRRELPRRSKEPLTKEGELPKPGAVSEDVPCVDVKKEEGFVLDKVEKSTPYSSQEAVSGQTTSIQETPGHSFPTRLKSKFVKQSPVPSSSEAIHTTSKSIVSGAGAKRQSKKVTSHVTTMEMSVSRRKDVAVDISVQTGIVTGETVREHVARETQTSSKPTSGGVSEFSDTNSTISDSHELAALNIQGLSISMDSQNSGEKGGEIDLGTKAMSVEALSAYKLADLKSMAKSRGLKGYSKLKKGELIELLSKQNH